MNWIITVALIAMACGILVVFSPKSMVRINEWLNKVVVLFDKQVMKYHVGVGICIILASIFLFSYGYYLGWR